MSSIQLGVYLIATFLAIRSLSSLMTHHRQHYLLERVRDIKAEIDEDARQTRTMQLEEHARELHEARALQLEQQQQKKNEKKAGSAA
ncbi:hypothetical protein Pla110_38120 [Polystyrenella longa]|uniref:Uncharacterized protein n=1 Tax=Polystyrenella longa TaxID=2528007 RepID=A0A518CS45_9PLAN|nr:hypothetical protein [Polystyrenella longa]QDU82057.1 hypothetical protein Pla110_38120 [Polystyrenella longa]